jgi:hypothetical protein
MKKYSLLFLFSIAVHSYLHAQEKIGAEVYNYFKTTPAIQPIIHLQSAKNWYAELRYNYEDAETFSLYGGKKFTIGDDKFSITPMLGYSIGKFNGASLAFNAETEFQQFFLSSQTQYSLATQKNSQSFFFSWSEAGYNVCDNFYTGLSVQYTAQKELNEFKPGVLVGFSFKNILLPVYVFNPFQPGRSFIVGLVYEYSYKKKR